MAIDFAKPPLQTIHWHGREITILRLDKVHPIVSGNKKYKLQGYLDAIVASKLEGFVTFGGAYSNHLHAAAYTAHAMGYKAAAYIRGEVPLSQWSSTLHECHRLGMELHFLTRAQYAQKTNEAFLKQIEAKYPKRIIIPEGGSGVLGAKGVAALQEFIAPRFTHILLAIGSGTTLEGLSSILAPQQQIIGFAPMKNGKYLEHTINTKQANWQVIDKYHLGGFGKYHPELIHFMNDIYKEFQLPLDIVYTSKLFWGLSEMLQEGYFAPSDNIFVIHTGGLQGNTDIEKLLY